MVDSQDKKQGLVPFLSIHLDYPNNAIQKFSTECPNILLNIEYKLFSIKAEGRVSGQPFTAAYPNIKSTGSDFPMYISFNFSQQNLSFYQRMSEGDGAEKGILFMAEKPEPRDEERQKNSRYLFFPNTNGRLVLSSDTNISEGDMKAFERLDKISAYFTPTIIAFYRIFRGNDQLLDKALGSGTLDSLLVPEIK